MVFWCNFCVLPAQHTTITLNPLAFVYPDVLGVLAHLRPARWATIVAIQQGLVLYSFSVTEVLDVLHRRRRGMVTRRLSLIDV